MAVLTESRFEEAATPSTGWAWRATLQYDKPVTTLAHHRRNDTSRLIID
jgi:hypothetical protein